MSTRKGMTKQEAWEAWQASNDSTIIAVAMLLSQSHTAPSLERFDVWWTRRETTKGESS